MVGEIIVLVDCFGMEHFLSGVCYVARNFLKLHGAKRVNFHGTSAGLQLLKVRYCLIVRPSQFPVYVTQHFAHCFLENNQIFAG